MAVLSLGLFITSLIGSLFTMHKKGGKKRKRRRRRRGWGDIVMSIQAFRRVHQGLCLVVDFLR